jgi:hypothetical protein
MQMLRLSSPPTPVPGPPGPVSIRVKFPLVTPDFGAISGDFIGICAASQITAQFLAIAPQLSTIA